MVCSRITTFYVLFSSFIRPTYTSWSPRDLIRCSPSATRPPTPRYLKNPRCSKPSDLLSAHRLTSPLVIPSATSRTGAEALGGVVIVGVGVGAPGDYGGLICLPKEGHTTRRDWRVSCEVGAVRTPFPQYTTC